jgi:hypothetical protein
VGPPGPSGPGGGLSTLISFPSSISLLTPAVAPDTGRSSALVYPGIGQASLVGFYQAPGLGITATTTEVIGGKLWPYFSIGFLTDAVPGPFQQIMTFNGAVPAGFSAFSAPFEWWYRYVSDTGPDLGNVATLTLELLNPNTGVVAASATRVLGDEGPYDATYVALSIPAATLNAVPFVPGDAFVFRGTVVNAPGGAGERLIVNFSKIVLPWS